ncbi:MAG: rRNA maturation RNase YbeY [Methylovulum sp.]|jgi:probable rRNA maturation factor
MSLLEIQTIFSSTDQPSDAQLQHWVETVLRDTHPDGEVLIRIVDEQESSTLNEQYRHKQGPTNILSFPFEAPAIPDFHSDMLGDLVICSPVLAQEAHTQNKPITAHWAHIVIHGVLHLLGYDHLEDDDAKLMEQKEITLLATLNFENPYQDEYASK